MEVKQSVSETPLKKDYSSKSLKCNFLCSLGLSVSANYAQIPHAHSSNPPAPLSPQRTKKTKETDKQTVSEKKIYIKERKLSFHIAAELRRQWRLISWFFQRRQREQPRRCSPLISAGRGAPRRAAAAPEPQVSPW